MLLAEHGTTGTGVFFVCFYFCSFIEVEILVGDTARVRAGGEVWGSEFEKCWKNDLESVGWMGFGMVEGVPEAGSGRR